MRSFFEKLKNKIIDMEENRKQINTKGKIMNQQEQEYNQEQQDIHMKYEKVKKPFYKRWWFIAIVVLIVLGAVGGGANEVDKQSEVVVEKENEEPKEEEGETVAIVGELHSIEDKEWIEEFKLVDKENNEYMVTGGDKIPENQTQHMEDGIIYKIIGDKIGNEISLTGTETLADNWDSYEAKTAINNEIKQIEEDIRARVKDQYPGTTVEKLDVNVNANVENAYIVLPFLKWDVKNRPKMTREMLETYSDDLAATLAKYENINDITVFWEVPYHKEGTNVSKQSYTRSGDQMSVGEKWYDPLIRE